MNQVIRMKMNFHVASGIECKLLNKVKGFKMCKNLKNECEMFVLFSRLLRKRKGETACCCLCSLFQLISSLQICAQVLSFSCVVCFALNISCVLLSRSNLPNDWIWFHLGSGSWMLPPLVQTDCILILVWRILYNNNIYVVMIPHMAVIYWIFEYFPSSPTLEKKMERVWGLKFMFFNSLLAISMHSKIYWSLLITLKQKL